MPHKKELQFFFPLAAKKIKKIKTQLNPLGITWIQQGVASTCFQQQEIQDIITGAAEGLIFREADGGPASATSLTRGP